MLLSVEGYLNTCDSTQVDIKLLLEDLRFIISSHESEKSN